MSKKRRRRKKSGGGGGGGMAVMTLQPGEVPTDEQLETEALALGQAPGDARRRKVGCPGDALGPNHATTNETHTKH